MTKVREFLKPYVLIIIDNILNIRVMRIFNTYGPRMVPNDGRVISNFIVQALKNKSLTIYGEGLQTRSFAMLMT